MEYLFLILAIAGGMCFGFVLIVLTIYFLFRFMMRRAYKEIANVMEGMPTGIVPFMQPLRIKLERVTNAEWNDNAAIKKVAKPLAGVGFEDVGIFVMDEVPDVQMQALVQPEEKVYAVVYEHPDKGVWFELVSRFEDGGSFSYSTAEETGLDRPPISVVERFEADIDPAKIYKQHIERRPNKELSPASSETFKADFELAYAEEMDWRFERGGFTQEEIRSNLKLTDANVSNQTVKQVHAMQQAQVNQWLQVKLQESFRAKANVTDLKWRKIEHRVVFIHDRLTGDEVHGIFSSCLDWDDEDAAQESANQAQELVEEGAARTAFTRMLETLPAERVPKKLGHVVKPVAADVYLLKETNYDSDL